MQATYPHPAAPVSGATRRAPGATITLALAGQVAARHPPPLRPRVPLDRVCPALAGGVRGAAVRRPLSARDLRLQPRCDPLDLARGLLRLRRKRHRPLPALHARRRSRLSGAARDRLPGAAATRAAADRLVAARHPAVLRGRHLRRRRRRHRLERNPPLVGRTRLGRPDRPARPRRGARAALPRRVPPLDLRPGPRPQPLGAARRRLRGADDARVSAVPRRQRRERTRRLQHRSDDADTSSPGDLDRRPCQCELGSRARPRRRCGQPRGAGGSGSAGRRRDRARLRPDPARRRAAT